MAEKALRKEGLPATVRGEATRRRLLDAAEQEFGERGFHAASVSAVTLRAGVSQGTFYIYFPSKEAIFSAVVEEVGRALRKHMGIAASRPGDRLQAQRAGLEAFLDFVQRHPGMYRIVQESQFVDAAVYRAYYERLAEGYARTLAQDAARGALAPGEALNRAWAIMAIGHFLGLRYCLWQGRMPEPAVLDAAMDFIADGIAPRIPGFEPPTLPATGPAR